jgi:hypothetical protein
MLHALVKLTTRYWHPESLEFMNLGHWTDILMLIGEFRGMVEKPESGEGHRLGSQAPGYDVMIASFQPPGIDC